MKSESTKQLIMDTAWKHFTQYGFAGTNLEKLCQETGITRGPLYYYFKDKADLYRQIIVKELEKAEESYLQIYSSNNTILEKIERDMNLCFAENPLLQKLEADVSGEEIKKQILDLWDKVFQLRYTALQKAIENNEIKSDYGIEEIMYFIFVSFQGIVTLDITAKIHDSSRNYSREKSIEIFLNIIKERYLNL